MNETFEALVKRQQETRVALETVEQGSLQHRILDDTLHSANYALAQHAEEAVAYIAALESALAAAEETVKFREATIRDLCDKLDLEGIDCDDCRDFATADAANALADGGE